MIGGVLPLLPEEEPCLDGLRSDIDTVRGCEGEEGAMKRSRLRSELQMMGDVSVGTDGASS